VEDRYTGDIGDYGKFGLLRALVKADPKLLLGLIWYLYPDEKGNADGKHVRYLCQSKSNDRRFRDCDSKLYVALRGLVDAGNRRVNQVPKLDILPEATVYFEEPLDFAGPPSERIAARKAWLDRALDATTACDILLLDPDNGLQCAVTKSQRRAGKYVYLDEIAAMFAREKTIILYQHLDRSDTAENQMAKRADRLEAYLGLPAKPRALRYHRGSGRAYYFLTQTRHSDLVDRTIKALTSEPWSQHFTLAI
jgi:hypothetical protein